MVFFRIIGSVGEVDFEGVMGELGVLGSKKFFLVLGVVFFIIVVWSR